MIKLGLTGWPLSHSLSPRIHTAALTDLNLEGSYDLYPIDPAESHQLEKLLESIRRHEIQGLNVTIPHKRRVFDLVDELTPSARSIGAVNTVYMEGSQLIGHNTDAPGFAMDLRNVSRLNIDHGGTAIILGAGGSSRAVIFELFKRSWKIIIAARNVDQGRSLANFYCSDGGPAVSAIPLEHDAILPYVSDLDLIINTTPVGMYPNITFSPWPGSLPFPPHAFVYDLIYNPGQTALVKSAQEAGLDGANGLGMLIEQAALAFEIWTGRIAPRAQMYSAVANF